MIKLLQAIGELLRTNSHQKNKQKIMNGCYIHYDKTTGAILGFMHPCIRNTMVIMGDESILPARLMDDKAWDRMNVSHILLPYPYKND